MEARSLLRDAGEMWRAWLLLTAAGNSHFAIIWRVILCSFLSNLEDGAFSSRCSVSMKGCHFERNGQSGSGDGMTSLADGELTLEDCVFAHHAVSKACVGLRVNVGGSEEVDSDDAHAPGDGQVGDSNLSADVGGGSIVASVKQNAIQSCQFLYNAGGCHVTLSPFANPPIIHGCMFFGNKNIGKWFN